MPMIKIQKLIHDYIKRDDEGNAAGTVRAIDGIDLHIEPGQFIAILGHNGSGKSTLAKHLNALLFPTEGTVWVDGYDTKDEKNLWEIRREAGMVFQNPDNQIIAQVVEEDVGFGPENIGVPTQEIWTRVEEGLKTVGMLEHRKKSPNRLSGGQKQRVSIAGVIAMQPKCIILDEPTAMLDPNGRKEVIKAAVKLNREKKITVILITHYMEEAIEADTIFVMETGKVVMRGTPHEIFSQVEKMKELHLDVPQVTLLAYELRKAGLPIPVGILTKEQLADALLGPLPQEEAAQVQPEEDESGDLQSETPNEISNEVPNEIRSETSSEQRAENGAHPGDQGIRVDDICFVYERGTAMQVNALDHISVDIPNDQFIGLIGHTGSGKSTFVQTLNGLLKVTSGHVYYNGEDIESDHFDKKKLRSNVGLVFQYPEHQLFEVDVLTDVMFGPKNLGMSDGDAKKRAIEALESVKMPKALYKASPFDLSGGEKRRAAIAGVLAMRPKILILDEPTAGLDPRGRDEILGMIADMKKNLNMTIILVSHSMDDIANYVDRIMVMSDGSLLYDDEPVSVFRHVKELENLGLSAPQITYIMKQLKERGLDVNTDVLRVSEAAAEILAHRRELHV